MKFKPAILGLILLLGISTQSPPVHSAQVADSASETKEQRDARMAWWREAKFGMFVHWGLYAIPAGSWNGKPINGFSEWMMKNAKIPVADWAKLSEKFDPQKFNADEWMALAEEAGMKYMVVTTKHHDGFAMFHTKVDSFNVYDSTPFKRDPIKELSLAAPKHNIRFGIYYSNSFDWHHPGGDTAGEPWDDAQKGDRTEYVRNVVVPHLTELLTNYGPICELWFDGNLNKEQTNLVKPVLKLQPQMIVDNRLGAGFSGDFQTPENYIPGKSRPGIDWETCMTTNRSWGYRAGDTDFHSTQVLLQSLVEVVSKGGNFLLNVGPDANGEIPPEAVQRLREIGKWMKINGDSIYGTTLSPFPRRALWGWATQKPGKLFLHIFTWPLSNKILVPIQNQATKAYLLASPNQNLAVTSKPDGVEIQLPATAPDAIDSVVALEYAGDIAPLPSKPATAGPDGIIRLNAVDADIETTGPPVSKLEGNEDHPNIDFVHDEDILEWPITIAKPGTYKITLTYAVEPKEAGKKITLLVGNQSVTTVTQATKGNTDFEEFEVGTIQISQTGLITLKVRTDKGAANICRLESVKLMASQ